MSHPRADVAIVGAGILGLAHAYVAAKAGKSVVVLERSPRAAGASVRNFGMVWPIGQPAGTMLSLSLRSRELWLEILGLAKLPRRETGSLHVAYREDEAAVAQEFAEVGPKLGYQCSWLTALQGSRALARRPARWACGWALEQHRTYRRPPPGDPVVARLSRGAIQRPVRLWNRGDRHRTASPAYRQG